MKSKNNLTKTITIYNHGTVNNPVFKVSLQDTESDGYTDHNEIDCPLSYNIKNAKLYKDISNDGYDIKSRTFSDRLNENIPDGSRGGKNGKFRFRGYKDGWLFAYDDTHHIVKVINADSNIDGYVGHIEFNCSEWTENQYGNTQIKVDAKTLRRRSSHKKVLEIKIDKTPEMKAIERAEKAESKLKSVQQQNRILKSKGSDDLERNLIKDDYTKQLIKIAQQLEEKGVDVLSTLEELNNQNDENNMNEQTELKRVTVSSSLSVSYAIKEVDDTSITVSVEIPEGEDELLVDLTGLEDIFVGSKTVSAAPPAVLDESLDVGLDDIGLKLTEKLEEPNEPLIEQLKRMSGEELQKTYTQYVLWNKLDDLTDTEFEMLSMSVSK